MTSSTGLRERKKAATKEALSKAAIKLASANGLAAATADAIAAEVGVSTRTFHNYFPSKEDAILYGAESSVDVWVAALRARPADEPIWESLQNLAVAYVSDPANDPHEMSAVSRLIEESPALMAKTHRMHENIGRHLGVAIAERTGTDVDSDLYPNLLQMVVGCAIKTSLELWLSGNAAGRAPHELVSEAFDLLRRGLPQPGCN
ncbi:TetR family transcriptional regulator [Antrihabitans sp. YC2-6]|uniref:acyl-CoA-like ligand-binding transcription factor n=1 Tax=Antrihabitans sp. YC2-6 TaxID=2799498 RepID=UPI0018F41BAC|nr:TetR family transcriptional regulator [Antrihabitans sp. YC2-6]MBJ8346162.1 TetR family transcriptional regulator [Antrihabitans sp. YC2-6]